MLRVVVIYTLWCLAGGLQSADQAVIAAVERLFRMPQEVDLIVDRVTGDAARKAAVRTLLQATLTGPLEARFQNWINEISFDGDEVLPVMDTLRHQGSPAPIAVTTISGGRGAVTTQIITVERHSVEVVSVAELFRIYPISNLTQESAESALKKYDTPDSVGLEVRSTNALTVTVVQTTSGWRVSDLSVKRISANLVFRASMAQ